MPHCNLSHVPWTCEWGQFGTSVEHSAARDAPVYLVSWICQHPVFSPHFKPLCRDECQRCLLWNPLPRYRSSPPGRPRERS